MTPSQWLARVDFRPAVALRLVCFAHAGSGAAPFMRWLPRMPERVALCPIRSPGRGMLALVAALVAIAYYRITAGPEALAAKLAELLPFALPWWVWALVFAHLLMRLQRLRSRLSEID